MKTLAWIAAALLPLAALAQPQALLQIDDPEGDDVGDGSLVYPQDSSFTPGDLDLRSLRVFADGNELRFEVALRNPVRDPSTARSGGPGNEDLALFARRGFYAFNLDLYLDLDHVPGSGLTAMLPGRGARLDAAYAWDKAIVLTPRPELMRRQLREALVATGGPAGSDAEAEVDRRVFFASNVRVRSRVVSFTVPQSFVSAAQIGDASLVGVLTAARLSVELGLGGLLGRTEVLPTLGAQQPQPGRPLDGFGYLGSRAPGGAIVDLLTPEPRQQALQLAPGAAITGLDKGNRWGATLPAASVGTVAAAGSGWFGAALDAVLRGTPPPQAAAAPVPVPVAAPVAAPAPVPPAAPAPAVKPRADDIEERMATLKRLRDGGLITEDEYQKKRRELLDRL